MKLLTQNTKMKKSSTDKIKIFNFGITAVKSCPYADKCKVGCYADSGAYRFGNVRSVFDKRLELTKQKEFIPTIISAINTEKLKATKKGKQLVIRIHDSGDFYSKAYLMKWIEVITTCNDVLFYCYTKSIPYFVGLDLPSNFKVIYSYGGKCDDMIKEGHFKAKVFSSERELLSNNYVNGTDTDLIAAYTPHKNIGLVYHGHKSKDFSK